MNRYIENLKSFLAEHTRKAFVDGVLVGMHLFEELKELPNDNIEN